MAAPELFSPYQHQGHSIRQDCHANSSSDISAGEVLQRSSAPDMTHHGIQSARSATPDTSANSETSSHSGTGSVRVRIKAKYLKERRSPFESSNGSLAASSLHLPPALPGNLPAGYEEQREMGDVQRHFKQDAVTGETYATQPLGSAHVSSPSVSQMGNEQLHSNGKGSTSKPFGSDTTSSTNPQLVHTALRSVRDIMDPQEASRLEEHTASLGQSNNDAQKFSRKEGVKVKNTLSSNTVLSVKASGILQQGAPTSGVPSHGAQISQPGDVRVTQFSKGQRQQVMREQLLKRHEGAKPTKRYIQPKLVPSSRQNDLKQEASNTRTDDSSMAAATAAAAAAVAATVPLIKTQSDLESKMNQIMEKLSVLEHTGTGHPSAPLPPRVHPVGQRWGGEGVDVQQELEELTQLRLERLRGLQREHQEMQAAMKEMSARNDAPSSQVMGVLATGNANSGPPSNATHPPTSQTSNEQSTVGSSPQSKSLPRSPVHLQKNLPLHAGSEENRVPQSGRAKLAAGEQSTTPPKRAKHDKYTPAVTFHHPPAGREAHSGVALQRPMVGPSYSSSHGTQTSPLDTPAPRRSAPVPHARESRAKVSHLGRGLLEEILSSHDEEERAVGRKQFRGSKEYSPLTLLNVNTSNPRNPVQEAVSEGHSPARSDDQENRGGYTSPTVKRAQRVVQQLDDLNREVKTNIQHHEENDKTIGTHQVSPDREYWKISDKLRQEAERDMDRRRQAWMEPAPLDDYLRRTKEVHPTLGPHSAGFHPPAGATSPSQHNAPVLSPPCKEAQNLLSRVQASKERLEASLETLTRAREDEHFYEVIKDMCKDGDVAELARIKRAVDDQIAAIDQEIKRELQHTKLHHKPNGRHSPPTRLPPDRLTKLPHQQQQQQQQTKLPQSATTTKSGQAATGGSISGRPSKKRVVQAKIDTGLRRMNKGDEVKGQDEQNKENLKQSHSKSPVPTHSKFLKSMMQDERYIEHVYGQTRVQAKRSTLKDAPYLHYTNRTPTKVKKPIAHHAADVKVPDYAAPKTQSGTHQKRVGTTPHPTPIDQYYFNPYPQQVGLGAAAPQLLPSHIGVHSGPAHGQLIPMAIPLGQPRMGAGLAQPVVIKSTGPEQGVVRPSDSVHPARERDGSNVAVINIRRDADHSDEPREMDRSGIAVVDIEAETDQHLLSIQHLPNVDIDSIPATPVVSQDRMTSTPSVKFQDLPGPAPDNVDMHMHNENPPEEEEEEEAGPETSPGIAMRGASADRQTHYHGPPFPPQQPPPLPPQGRMPSSDQLADDIRRMELLQNRAVDWVEQELIARLISEMHRSLPERPLAQREPQHRPDSPTSSEGSSHLVGALGGGGLQLFVDAGQPVDSTLVNRLVQEVLEEKISLCLGQHERESLSVTEPSLQDVRQPTPQPVRRGSPIPTPEPTPPQSPIPVPSRDPSPTPRDRIPTPDVSEAGEGEIALGGAESETESLKDLMQEPDAAGEGAATIAAPGPTAVTTPPTTPPPVTAESPPPQSMGEAETPRPSPRDSPEPLVAPLEPMVTPTPTPEPHSPVASEPEADIFQETIRSPSPTPRRPSPPPTPLPPAPPKPTTPAPPSVESSSTTEPIPTDSTTTTSTGRDVSEGEWLVSEQEAGRVPDETLFDVPDMELFEESSQSSTASTIRGPGRDQEPRSEGEVDPRELKLTRDPVVALLARLRQPPPGAMPAPFIQHQEPAGVLPSMLLPPGASPSHSASSEGEVSDGQRPGLMPPTERLLFEEAFGSEASGMARDRRRSVGEVRSSGQGEDGIDNTGEVVPSRDDAVPSSERTHHGLDASAPQERAGAPPIHSSPTLSAGRKESQAPFVSTPVPRVIQVGNGRSQVDPAVPVEGSDMQGPLVPTPVPRVIQVRKESGQVDPEEGESGSEEEEGDGDLAEADMAGMSATAAKRDRPLPPSLYSTMASDLGGTRTMTPDAMNMDPYLQSGYLSQTFSQSEGGNDLGDTTDLDESRFLGRTNGTLGATGFNVSGAILGGSSHLGTSTMFSEDSLEIGAMRRRDDRLGGTQRSFQVTLPSIASPDGEGEDSEDQLQGGETVSDVSELTL